MVWNKMLYQRISLANSTSKYQVPRAHCGCRATNIQFTGQPASLNNLLYPRALHGWARSRVNQKKTSWKENAPAESLATPGAGLSLSLSALMWALRQGLDRGAAAGDASVCPDRQHSTRSSTSRSPAVTKWWVQRPQTFLSHSRHSIIFISRVSIINFLYLLILL